MMKLVLMHTTALLFALTPVVPMYGQSTLNVGQHSVRFSAAAGGELLRVRVSTPDGQEVFDSGSTSASVIDWNRQERFGIAPGNGIYFAEVTSRDAAGQVSRTTMDANLSENPAEALESDAGTSGKIAKWITSTTLGNSVITESSAKIGIGGSSPTAVLHVSGSQPAPQAGSGMNAARVLQVLDGKGGNSTTGGTAGRGGSVYIGSGPVGDPDGTGGDILIVPGGPGIGSGQRGNLLLAPSGGRVFIGTGNPASLARVTIRTDTVEWAMRVNAAHGSGIYAFSGAATVELPEWFETLNRDFRYQLTCIGGFAPVYIAAEIKDNRFQIAGGTPGLKVSWQVTGIRQDAYAKAHPVQVVEEKPAQDRGFYLHPTVFGYGEEKGIGRVRQEKPRNYSEATPSLASTSHGAAASGSVVE